MHATGGWLKIKGGAELEQKTASQRERDHPPTHPVNVSRINRQLK